MKYIYIIIFSFCLLNIACNKEYLNPSTASEVQVVSSPQGLIAIANGLQQKYSIGRTSPIYNALTTSGLLSGELVVLNAGNTDENNLGLGAGNVNNSNNVLRNLWEQLQLIKSNANLILDNIDVVNDTGIKTGLICYASIYKAIALGTLPQFWESAPITVEKNAPFNTRAELLTEAIQLLQTAKDRINSVGVNTNFTSRIVAGIDLKNTINALLARYNLLAGNYDAAIAAALTVDITKVSNLNFAAGTSDNPISFVSFSNRNVTEPKDTFFSLPVGLRTTANDLRRNKFFKATTAPASLNLGASTTGFFASVTTSIPLYRIGEVYLILAESYARKKDSTNAVIQLNKVLTKNTDATGIGAGQPAYNGVNPLLTEIYKQRCIELYLTGFRFEDSKRFGRDKSERGNRNFMPYPLTERDNNTNTPTDPTE